MRGRYERRTWEARPDLTEAPPRYRRACGFDTFLPEPLEADDYSLPEELATVVSDAELAIAQLNHSAAPSLAPLARLLLRTESIASSKVEGLQVDAKQLARAEVRDDVGRRASRESLEILANVDAMQFAIEETASTQITPYEIVAIHRVLMERPNSRIAGRLRDHQSWIGGNDFNPCGADFVPPPPELVANLLDDLCRFIARDDLPILVQAALAHAQFETVHPFDDGNGRTGRALVQVILRRRALAPAFVPPISVVLARERERYIRGLTAYREDHALNWIEVFSLATTEASKLAERYLRRVTKLQEEWRDRLKTKVKPRSDAAAWNLIDVLPAHPVLTVPVGVAATGKSKPAVNGAIPGLVAAGVLNPLSDSRRNRAWEATELLDLIVDLESGIG